jgi:hypothetical protein
MSLLVDTIQASVAALKEVLKFARRFIMKDDSSERSLFWGSQPWPYAITLLNSPELGLLGGTMGDGAGLFVLSQDEIWMLIKDAAEGEDREEDDAEEDEEDDEEEDVY